MVDYCGMIPTPTDYTAEYGEPARFYQRCAPEIFRLVNSVADISQEILDLECGNRSATTNIWETAHFQSITTDWEDELGMLKTFGFSSVFDGENIARFNGNKEFDHAFGYFDEGMYVLVSA
jgi:hypothetical protein